MGQVGQNCHLLIGYFLDIQIKSGKNMPLLGI